MNEQAQAIIQDGPQVGIEERRDAPGMWTVEAIGSDGEVYQAFFYGPEAQERAREYASFKYAA